MNELNREQVIEMEFISSLVTLMTKLNAEIEITLDNIKAKYQQEEQKTKLDIINDLQKHIDLCSYDRTI